ncbi:GMC oxidoreductase [Bradyrhizobium sp. AT1]|uniref:GMC oxidoreductase n=1 Tax=Bradyrhizobium sp. AT1 TaxID=574934 RepID=UPI0009FEBB92|nr:GMC oxidoreductase [Bradyrhizobium sp. AT1]
MLKDGIAGLEEAAHDLCVVGAGPVGVALATNLARRGRRVLVLESGGTNAEPDIQDLSSAMLLDPKHHDDMMIAVARRLGGTSNLWGGRCLPYDPIDFERRDWVDARWPIGIGDIQPYLGKAALATLSGEPTYREPIPELSLIDNSFSCDTLERWANTTAAQTIHSEELAKNPKLDLRTHATLTGIDFSESGRVQAINITHSKTGERIRLRIDTLVIAAGGLESARLLLATQRSCPSRFGGEDGPLGRTYMGHLVGEIADIVFTRDVFERAFDFHVDLHGSYVRRRIAASADIQRKNQLLNAAFWPVVPPIGDARHGSAILSLVYLAMSFGPLGRLLVAEVIRRRQVSSGSSRRAPHFANVLTGLPAALAFGYNFMRRRYMHHMRLPGLFIYNRAHRYGLSYHAEQAPRRDSRVRLSEETDRLSVPKLIIDYRFCAQDAQSVIKSHSLLEAWLQHNNLGHLEYRVRPEERAAAILDQACHGTHQIGLARMGYGRNDAVVDANLQTFDASNLYVASTAVLPTSSQANPTLTAVALALRLADHLAMKETTELRGKTTSAH